MHVILASASPRRMELLKKIFSEFDVLAPDIEEIVPDNIPLFEGPMYLAVKKAEKIYANYPESLIIAADTGVFVDNIFLGKPDDKNHATEMIKRLSGKKHQVITGCCVIYKSQKKCFSDISIVEFQDLTEEEINDYVNTDEPYDKAGGYAIQGLASSFIRSLEGDYDNVVGLPVEKLEKYIKLSYNL